MSDPMRKYWIVASSNHDPFHWADGKVVLADISKSHPTVYVMDLEAEATSFVIPQRYLAKWHKRIENHSFCYCKRK